MHCLRACVRACVCVCVRARSACVCALFCVLSAYPYAGSDTALAGGGPHPGEELPVHGRRDPQPQVRREGVHDGLPLRAAAPPSPPPSASPRSQPRRTGRAPSSVSVSPITTAKHSHRGGRAGGPGRRGLKAARRRPCGSPLFRPSPPWRLECRAARVAAGRRRHDQRGRRKRTLGARWRLPHVPHPSPPTRHSPPPPPHAPAPTHPHR